MLAVRIAFAPLLLSLSFASVAASAPQDAEAVRSLALYPEIKLSADTCEIRGALAYIQSNQRTPISNTTVHLIDDATDERFKAVTDKDGVYTVSVPMSGEPRFLRESVRLGALGTRTVLRVSPAYPVCGGAKVDVGTIEQEG